MRGLLVCLVILLASAAPYSAKEVCSREDMVLCCYYCGPCEKRKCEPMERRACLEQKGRLVDTCQDCAPKTDEFAPIDR